LKKSLPEDVDLNNDDVEEMIEPDDEILAQQEEELDEDEDVLDIKKTPELAAELSEDPVRLYLREIGQVKLLDADSEFRLATLIEADRLIAAFLRRPRKDAGPYPPGFIGP
jgi:RNA polymerase primary sigma factor